MLYLILLLSGFIPYDGSNIYKEEGKTIVFVGASWCGPCQNAKNALKTSPLTGTLSDEIIYVDADKHPDVVKQLKVKSFPTTFVYEFKDWKYVGGTVIYGFHKDTYVKRVYEAYELDRSTNRERTVIPRLREWKGIRAGTIPNLYLYEPR